MKKLFTTQRPLIISGPCSAETQEQVLTTARDLASTGKVQVLRAGIWKPRTKPGGFEGVGEIGLEWLCQAKKETGLPIATEVANASHVELALKHGVDLLWIGARTTVNPFSVQEIADSLRGVDVPVLVKNPMNPDIDLWCGAIERLSKVGLSQVGLIHRGFSSFGVHEYRNTPMWHLAAEMKIRMGDVPMVCDPSHIGGRRDVLLEISQQAADMNFDGLIIESHCNPTEAWSDAAQQVTPQCLTSDILDHLIWRSESVDTAEYSSALAVLRSQIDHYDGEIFKLLGKRMAVSQKIGEVKKENGVTVLQTKRWDYIVHRILSRSEELGLSEQFLTMLLGAIHQESISRQNRVMGEDIL